MVTSFLIVAVSAVFLQTTAPVPAPGVNQEEADMISFKPLQDLIAERQQAFSTAGIDLNQVWMQQGGEDCRKAERKSVQVRDGKETRKVSPVSAVDDVVVLMRMGEIRASDRRLSRIALQFNTDSRPWRAFRAFYAEVCSKDLAAAYEDFRYANRIGDARRVAFQLFNKTGKVAWNCRYESSTGLEADQCK